MVGLPTLGKQETVTELVGAARQEPAPAVRLELTLPGDARVFFASVADVDLSPRGEFLVLDRINKTLYRFRSDGTLLDSLGRPGLGPGEFRHPAQVAVGPDGELAVADLATARVQYWAADGGFLGATRLPGPPWGLWWTEAGLHVRTYRQHFLEMTVSYVSVAPGVDSAGPATVSFATLGDERTGQTRGVSCAFCAAAMTPGGEPLVVAADTSYRVAQIGDGGLVVRTWSREGLGAVRRSAAELEEMRRHFARARVPGFDPERFRYKPRFAAIDMDGHGRLWALRSAGDGKRTTIDVFAAGGDFLGTVELTEPLDRMVVRRDRLLGFGENSLGEPTVWVYRVVERVSKG